ncbi:MAG: hypothetical protein K1566_15810 [Candidatus Thiodiazotropha sp. (ex. Lucinisca nassula)]|nr:hypothetical protein [Candidatus Thiodiazotropha sp. (ex. Lucinisca nassula)]
MEGNHISLKGRTGYSAIRLCAQILSFTGPLNKRIKALINDLLSFDQAKHQRKPADCGNQNKIYNFKLLQTIDTMFNIDRLECCLRDQPMD